MGTVIVIGLILAIIGIIAAGVFVANANSITARWIKNKIKKKLAQKNAKKVAFGDLKALINEAVAQNDNKTKLDSLDDILNLGYSHYMATIDDGDQILGEVELIKDENEILDADVEKMLGHKGLVVIEV